jgi:hypothetical protein
MVATSRSTTITTSIRTTILTATSIAKAATGSTTHNTAETLHTAIEERPKNLAAAGPVKGIGLVAGVPESPIVRAPEPGIGRGVELETVPVVARARAIVLAAVAPERAQVAEPELQVGEPETARVAVELLQDRARRHVPAGVAAPIK